ncbi:hypothetical protein ACH5BF_09335 [Arcobacter sp. YIC-464]|uniref:hypothetical protein n=1 Tax=Arcobacter sp. YIC-464 TaxID=3376631 RepID=UPI003C16514A
MKILILLMAFLTFSFSNEFSKIKNCEKIQLSRYTVLVSCHQIDYIIEYTLQDDEEKDNIKKITALTVNDKKIIMDKSKIK